MKCDILTANNIQSTFRNAGEDVESFRLLTGQGHEFVGQNVALHTESVHEVFQYVEMESGRNHFPMSEPFPSYWGRKLYFHLIKTTLLKHKWPVLDERLLNTVICIHYAYIKEHNINTNIKTIVPK